MDKKVWCRCKVVVLLIKNSTIVQLSWKIRVQIINNYWTRLSKISWFVLCPKAEANNWSAISEFNNCFIIRSRSLFFFMNILGKRSDLPFSRKSNRKKEKGTVSFTHEQTIICRQLFAGHLVGCRPMKREKSLLRMIMIYDSWKGRGKYNNTENSSEQRHRAVFYTLMY